MSVTSSKGTSKTQQRKGSDAFVLAQISDLTNQVELFKVVQKTCEDSIDRVNEGMKQIQESISAVIADLKRTSDDTQSKVHDLTTNTALLEAEYEHLKEHKRKLESEYDRIVKITNDYLRQMTELSHKHSNFVEKLQTFEKHLDDIESKQDTMALQQQQTDAKQRELAVAMKTIKYVGAFIASVLGIAGIIIGIIKAVSEMSGK